MIRRGLTRQIALLNRYYLITKFYSFLKDTSIKGGVVTLAFVLLIIGLEYFFLDFNFLLNNLVETYSPLVIFTFFLLSETILGVVPPEIFIAWAAKSVSPWLYLFILATMSYVGGVISYYIGSRLYLIPAIKNHIEVKVSKHIINLRKWGGLLVFVGAMLPLPHSIVSMACGLIKFKFSHYLLWALLRYLRFAIYALVIFRIF